MVKRGSNLGVRISGGRGNHVATRVPLELALRKGPSQTAKLWYYTTQGDLNTKVEVNDIALSDISDRVAAATVQLAGPGVNIVSNPLHLEINAGLDQYNLDIIDLPGIVANPTGGEYVHIVCETASVQRLHAMSG